MKEKAFFRIAFKTATVALPQLTTGILKSIANFTFI